MKITRTGVMLAAALTANAGIIGSAYAEVSPQEAAKLGKELTCVGAEQAGNAAGTIPRTPANTWGGPRLESREVLG